MRLRLSLSILLLLLVVTAGQPVLAVDTTLTPTTSTTNRIRERQEKIREEVKEAQEKRLAQIDELKTRIATREAEIKKRVEERNEQLENKLQGFKDRRKAEITERVSDNLNTINKKRVEMMTLHLSKIEEILGKVKDRVAERSEGKDVSNITKAITDAQTAIDAAKSALVTQAGKDYTVTVVSESTVRTDVQTKRDLLHTDLKTLHEKIVAARKATSNAIRTAYSTLGKGLVDASEGTPTPTANSESPTVTPTQSVTVTVTSTPTTTVTPTVTP